MLRCSKKVLAIVSRNPILGDMLQRSKNLTAQPLKVAALQLPCHLTQPFQIEWSMNMLTAEQIAAAQKANITTLFGLTTKAFEGMEKLIELNVQASKAAMAETADNVQAIMGAKDAQELLALQAALVQPLAEKTAAYSRHVYDITSGATSEFKAAAEAQSAESQKKFMAVVEDAAKNAPAGSETAVAMMKSTVAAANNAIESVQKAVKQSSDMAETNMSSMAATATQATKTSARKR